MYECQPGKTGSYVRSKLQMETFPVAENPQREQAIEAHSYLNSTRLNGHRVEYLVAMDDEVLPLFLYFCETNPIPILPGEYVPAHAPTRGYALLLKGRMADLKDKIFVPDMRVSSTESPLPSEGRGTICSVLCSDENFENFILYARQRGQYRLNMSDTGHACVRAIPMIEERLPPEVLLNATPLHLKVYPNKFNMDFLRNDLKMLLSGKFSVNLPLDSVNTIELTAMCACLLSDKDRWRIAESQSVLEHLIIHKASLENSRWVLCKACRNVTKFCHVSELIVSRFHHYLNPHFFLHRVLLARQVGQMLDTGQPSSDTSWFSGYGWQISYCNRCTEHVGWKFSRDQVHEPCGHDPALIRSTYFHPWSQYDSFFAFRTAAVTIE